MKKFKNKIAIYCENGNLIQAFEKELKQLGWKFRDNFGWCSNCTYIVLDRPGQDCNYANHNADLPTYNLPAQWDLALKLAAELEEEIPEYVEIVNEGYYISGFSTFIDNPLKVGMICKVSNKTPQSGYDKKIVVEFNNGKEYAELGCYKNETLINPSTKAAYDLQQQELANKELLEKLIKESGFKVGDKVGCKIPKNYNRNYSCDSCNNREFIITEFIYNSVEGGRIESKDGYNLSPAPKGLYIFSSDYSKWIIPVEYIQKAQQSKTLTLGSSNIEIKISKGRIEAAGREVKYYDITDLVQVMSGFSSISGWEVKHDNAKIGCSVFMLTELQQIVETYNELNK